ncbi:hypothetical protein AVEN_86646-1 [Araneus ventricosus]|uniref:Uncharacterized protein n=1 Tax=Araneus ventricosus TaxID=182803 RepID=A0A4Y2RYA5_ARAVE|nr:hypothetical protein AVEN_86646-1 [Araneus ventricosus]
MSGNTATVTNKEEYNRIFKDFGTDRRLGEDRQVYDFKKLSDVYSKVPGIRSSANIFIKRITKEMAEDMRYSLKTNLSENWATLPELKWFQNMIDGSSKGGILNEDFEKCNCLDKIMVKNTNFKSKRF